MKLKESAECHQTLSSGWGLGTKLQTIRAMKMLLFVCCAYQTPAQWIWLVLAEHQLTFLSPTSDIPQTW